LNKLDMFGGKAGARGDVLVKQTNFFYGDIRTEDDIDTVARKLADKTQRAIQVGRRQ
jgi:hypothetical protein